MKTKLMLLLAILLSVSVSYGQLFGPPDGVPKEYWKVLNRAEKKETRGILKSQQDYAEANEDNFDFFVPEVPLPTPEGRVMSGNTWYYDWHQTSVEAKRMVSMAKGKGKYVCFILDTGEPSYDAVLAHKYPGHASKSFTGEHFADGHSHATNIAGSQTHRDAIDNMGVAAPLAEADFFYQAYYKVCTNGGGCNYSWIASAIREATDFYIRELKPKGIRAGISMSLGGGGGSAAVNAAIKYAVDADLIIFASSGNNGQYNISYPAEHPDVYAIGAHDQKGKYTYFSNKGNETEDLFCVGAGLSIYSTCKGNSKCTMSGTSMGNPIANAIIGSISCFRPQWSWAQIIDFVSQHMDDVGSSGYDREHGHGSPRWTAILDALEDTDEPNTPTCNDGKKNGDEEGVDCGGSCPPCDNPPPPPGKVFPERVLSVSLEGTWPVAWLEAKTNALRYYVSDLDGVGGYTQDGEPLLNFNDISVNDMQWLDITDITLRTKSTVDAAITAEEMQRLMDDMWKGNRGVGLPYPADFDRAGKAAAFFTDLLADLAYGDIQLTVGSITFNDRQGHTLTYDANELDQWPRGSQPFSYDFHLDIGDGDDKLVQYKEDNPVTDPPSSGNPKVWNVTAEWVQDIPVTIGGGGLPVYEFEIEAPAGIYETSFKLSRYPSDGEINKRPPYNRNYRLRDTIKVEEIEK